MNNVPFVPRSPAGRKIHNLARREVRDDHDLRAAVHRALAERSGSAGPRTDDWTRPAFDNRRRATPPTLADYENGAMMQPARGTPAEIPTPLHERRWLREGMKLAAAAIVFGLVGALLVLVLGGDDEPSTPGDAPAEATPTTLINPTVDATAAKQSTRQAAQDAAHLAQTATVDSRLATATILDAADGIVATITVGREPQWVAATDDALWVANSSDGTVSRIDPTTNTVVATITVGPEGGSGPNGSPRSIAAYQDQVWVTNDAESTLVRIDPATNQVAQAIDMAQAAGTETFHANALVVDETGVWITGDTSTDTSGGRVVHLDPATGSVVASIAVAIPLGVASGFGSAWVVVWDDGEAEDSWRLVRIDNVTHEIVAEVPLEAVEAFYVATGASSVWVSQWGSSDITRIDPATNTIIATIDSGLGTGHTILVAESGIWVSSIFSNGVVRIDPTTNQPSPAIDTHHGNSVGIAELDGSIWVSHSQVGHDLVTRIDPTP